MDSAALFKQLLETAGVSVNGWGLFVSKEPDPAPHRAITCFNTGGLQPSPKWSLDFPSVQIRVRGFPNGYQESRAKAEECKTALLGIDPQDVNGGIDRLVSVIIRTDIADIGFDQTNRPIHTINFNLITQPKASGYRTEIPPIAFLRSGPPPTIEYPLDLVPGAVSAWSTRQMKSVTPAVINTIRRPSDNATMGIGSNPDSTYDDAAATTFLQGSPGTVVSWGDQSASSLVLAQANTSDQPAFDKALGVYGTKWTAGSTQNLAANDVAAIQDIFQGGGYGLFVVDTQVGANAHVIVGKTHWVLFLYGSQVWMVQDGSGGQGFWGTSDVVTPGLHIIEVEYNSNASTNLPVFRVDGTNEPLGSTNGYSGTSVSDVGQNLVVGQSAALVGGNSGFDGYILEGYLYGIIPSTTDKDSLRANVKAFWNTP